MYSSKLLKSLLVVASMLSVQSCTARMNSSQISKQLFLVKLVELISQGDSSGLQLLINSGVHPDGAAASSAVAATGFRQLGYGDIVPLCTAPLYGQQGYLCARVLLYAGARIDVVDCNGITPLHNAVACNNFELVQELASRGAQNTVRDCKNRTPYDLACALGVDDQIIQFLKDQMHCV